MQGSLVARKVSVRLSVCPSLCQMRRLWQNGRKICPDCYNIGKIVFWEKNGWWGRNFGLTGPHWSEIADFEPIFARSTSGKSSIDINRKSNTRFPMRLRWSSYVAPKPPKGSSKTQNGHFPSKIALRLKKVCYKVSLCENCQPQSCKAFIGLTIRAKMIGGGRPLLPEILGQMTVLE